MTYDKRTLPCTVNPIILVPCYIIHIHLVTLENVGKGSTAQITQLDSMRVEGRNGQQGCIGGKGTKSLEQNLFLEIKRLYNLSME